MNTKGIKFLAVLAVLAMAFAAFAVLTDVETDDATDPTYVAQIGDKKYTSLADAVDEGNGKTIKILTDIPLASSIEIDDGSVITIDLNENEISAAQKPFILTHGTLNLTGTGVVYESADDRLAAVYMWGSDTSTAKNYSVLNVGEDVTLRGWAGVMISFQDGHPHAYGVVVNIEGKVQNPGVPGTHTTAGHGVYINGTIADETGSVPEINIGSKANISSLGTGMYLAGYAKTTIQDGAVVTGDKTALEIRAGELNINGGSFTSNATTTEFHKNGNGTTSTGVALAVIQHTTMKNIAVTINGGTFTAKTPLAIKDVEEKAKTNVSVKINGGTYTNSNSGTTAILLDSWTATVESGKKLTLSGLMSIASGAVLKNEGTISLSGASSKITDGNISGVVGTNGIIGSGTISVLEGAVLDVALNAAKDKLCTNKVVIAEGGTLKFSGSTVVATTGAMFNMGEDSKITVESVKISDAYYAKITFAGPITTGTTGLADFLWTNDEAIIESGTFTLLADMNIYSDVKFTVNGTLKIGDGTKNATVYVKNTPATGTAGTTEVGKNGILGTGTVVVSKGSTLKLDNDSKGSMLTAADTKIMAGGVLDGIIQANAGSQTVAIMPTDATTGKDLYVLAHHNTPASSYWVASDGMTYTISGNYTVDDTKAPGALFDVKNSVVVKSGTISLASPITIPAAGSLTFEEDATVISGTAVITNNGTINYASPAQVYANVDNKGHIYIEGHSGDETVKEDTSTKEFTPSSFSDADVVVATAAVETAVIPEGKTLVIQNASSLTNVDVSSDDSTVSLVGMTSGTAKITVKAGDNKLVLNGLKGTVTITKGSIYIDGKITGGTIELDEGADVKMKGSIDGTTGDVKIQMKEGASKATVTILEEDSVTIENTNKLIIDAGVTLDVYGTITNKAGVAATLQINADAKLNVMSGGKIANITDGTSMTVTGKGAVYSGASINGVIITPANWTGKDANGGTWSFKDGELTLKNYNGSYNLAAKYDVGAGVIKTIAETITSIKITGDNKITYKLPAGDAATTIFGSDNSITEISTDDTASLTIDVDYSKLSKKGINEANVILSVANGFKMEGVDVTIVAKGSSDKWVDFDDNKGIRVTAIDGKGVMSIKNAELDIDVLSALDSKYVYAIESQGAVGVISIKNSEVDIKSAGTGIRSAGALLDDIAVSASVFTINAKHAAIFADDAKVTFDTCVKVTIAGELGIIAEDVEFDSCADVEISATEYAIVGFDEPSTPFELATSITLSHSNVSVKGNVYAAGTVSMTKSGFSVDGTLWIKNFKLTQDSVLTVKDLYTDGKGENQSVITKGIVTVMGAASFVGDLENNDVLNNLGTIGVYHVFTNNGTFNNSGKFFVYAKEQNLGGANDTIAVEADPASAAGKVKVKSIEITDAVMNADGTVAIEATVIFAKDSGDISSETLKKGTKVFTGTLSVSDLVDTTDSYYTLDLTNGTATIKVTYKKLTEGVDTKIGKSYTIDVAGKIVVPGEPDVEYDLQPNADGKTVNDETVTGSLIAASGADFKSTGTSSVILSEGEVTIFNSVTKTIGGKFVGDLTTYLSDLTVGAFVGDIYSKGTVTVTAKKLMIGDIVTDGVITINGTLEGNAITKDSVVIAGTLDGNVAVTAGTTAKTVTVGGKFTGDLYFYSKYLAKSTDKEGEESIATNVMAVAADMSTSEKTFIINLTAAKNATTSTPGQGGTFAFGTLNAPAATKAVQLTLNEGKIVVPNDVTLPERFEVIIEKDTTLEVAKNYKLNVKSAALKVSKDATRNFVITTDVSATYGTVEYIMTFDIEGGAYTIFSDVTYALSSCDEGAELTLGSAADINANVSVKKGVSIIVDGVKLDFKTFGLKMDEGAKIVLKGAGNLAFGITDKIVDDPDKENEYFTISGTIVYDDNAVELNGVRFSAVSTIAGKAATSTEASKINMTLTYNEGTVSVEDGTATGTITLLNAAYKLLKEDTTDTLVFGVFMIDEGAVFDAVAINDKFGEVTYKESTTIPVEYIVDEIKLMPTIVTVNGTLNLSGNTTIKGVYAGEGKVVLASGKTLTLAACDEKGTPGNKTVAPSIAAILMDNTDDANGFYLNLVTPAVHKTLEFTSKKVKDVNVMYIKGDFYFGEIAAIDGTDAYLDKVNIMDNAVIKADVAYIIDDSIAQGGLAAKIVYMKNGTATSEYKTLTFEVTFPEEDYTVYTFFKNVDIELVSDITIAGNLDNYNLADLVPGATKVDLSGNDVSITVAEGKTLTVNVPLIIGTPIDDLGADEGSALVGKFIIADDMYIVAYSDVDMLLAEIVQKDKKTAAVYSMLDIDDIPYAAIFANEDDVVLADVDKKIVPEIEGYTFAMWVNYNLGARFVGETNAYADFKAVLITITVKYVEGVDYYMDGLLFQVFDTPTDVEYGSYFTAKISDTTKYQGNPMINGVKTYTVEGPDTLVATGVTPIPEPPQPEPVIGDSGISLTDILLIVLVVLIAIMVVILVLRLNRS